MPEFKPYTNRKMRLKSECPTSWTVRNLVRRPGREFEDVVISSPRLGHNPDKGAIIELSLYPDAVYAAIPATKDEEALEDELAKTMRESPCKVGRYKAACFETTNQLGARIRHYVVKRHDGRFTLSFVVNPATIWSDYQETFDHFLHSFEFIDE